MKKILTTVLLTLLLFTLSGCGSAKGSLYKKSYVLNRVAKTVPSEKYVFDRIEPVPDKDVSTEIYYFKSSERDLEFRAINTRAPAFFESGLYAKYLNIKYVDDVHKLYEDSINRALDSSGCDLTYNRFCFDSFKDLEKIAKAILRADDIYKAELNYNTAEWLEKNPVAKCRYSVTEILENGKESHVDVGGIYINGTWDYNKLYDYMCYEYASSILREKIKDDPTVPEHVRKMAHVLSLKHVYINGVEVSQTGYQNTKLQGAYNNSESSYYADYCYKLGDYIIPYNTAVVPQECGPLATEEYLDVLAPGYDVEYKKGIYEWDYNGSHFKSFATTGDDDYVNSFIITKDGKDMQIPYVKCSEWTSPVHGVYVVGIPVHDFAKLFDLSLEIDEENESIYFTER